VIKSKRILIVGLIIFLLEGVNAYTQEPTLLGQGTPSVYKVTLKKFRVYNGTTWITLKEQDTTFDIASAQSAGQIVGNFFTGTIIPGTYSQVEITPSASFTMKGYVTCNGTTYYTSTTASNGTNSTADFDINNPPSDYGEAKITIYGYSEDDEMPPEQKNVNVVIKKGVTQTIKILFNVKNKLGLYEVGGGEKRLLPLPPIVTVNVQ